MHDAHVHDLHGEDRGGHWGRKDRGEGRRHAAHHHHVVIVPVQVKDLSQDAGDRAAELERRPLSAHGGAAQVREHRGEEDRRGEPKRHRLPGLHRGEDEVCAGVIRPDRLIEPVDQKRPHGKKEEKGRVRRPNVPREVDELCEGAAHEAQHHAADQGKGHPPEDEPPSRARGGKALLQLSF